MSVFFFNDTATTEIYTLSLHDALPICDQQQEGDAEPVGEQDGGGASDDHLHGLIGGHRSRQDDRGTEGEQGGGDRKSTRLNSSHANISYAVFCLKKKKRMRAPSRQRAV